MSAFDTNPASVDVGSLETYPLAVDATAYLPSGAATSSATATLTDLTAGTAYPAGIASSSLSGDIATVTLSGLVATRTYGLFVAFTFSDGAVLETRTTIKVPA